MKKIFVTGGTGFIGSNLIEKLSKTEEYDIYALVRYISNRTPSFPENVKVVYGDLRDGLMIKKIIKNISPEIVLHLGAISPVQHSFGHSQEVMETNFIGTINLAESNLENSNLKKFIMAGTSEMYGNNYYNPIRETDKLCPNQPYAISKVASYNYLSYLKEAYNFPSCVVRPFNTYGRTENFNFVTERIIYQMLTSKIVNLGDPSPIRDLLYVDDHVDGYMSILESQHLPDTVNLCTGKETSIEELTFLIQDKLNFKGTVSWNKTMKRPTEIYYLVGDNSLAYTFLKWKPKIDLNTGLDLTIGKIKNKIRSLK